MALHVRAMPAPEFDRWLAAQAAGPALGDRPAGGDTPGRRVFVAHGCAACHAVEATPGGPDLGPNLAQLADRTHLGAGLLPNDADALRRWITDVQAIKPGARMPSYPQLDAATLDALVAYLGTLR
jgi:cytochrome c oxidase subunit 2